ncbi:prolyl oligopeptidase family serine peptidase [Bacillus mangrovi]|uniref:Prolyl oligopeptidase family serine peptidase n=1 Tax=Metabacillus mangrovi TaxID=1491830 RepID=A0A7X2V3R1_9BACI|nr:alpha/beta hydrolase [Metabacillus mangrovi]MTH52273.1 prolyl oligopeptidase family serine peptidase [Metabacillus mangrovi]
MKKRTIGLGAVLSAAAASGFAFSQFLMYSRLKTDEEIIEKETKNGHFNKEEFEALDKREVSIPSRFGYTLNGFIAFSGNNRERFVIVSHGVTMNTYSSIKYMNLFLELGYNVLVYDHRRHGKSGGKSTSFGYYEKYDLQSAVHWLKREYGRDITLGIHGESLGAASMLLYAGAVEDGADFYIADCPFEDLEELLVWRMNNEMKKFPRWPFMPIASLFLKLRGGYWMKEVSPVRAVSKIKKPVLFIHGRQDETIPFSCSENLYNRKKGSKQIYLPGNTGHAMSYTENRREYTQIVDSFLDEAAAGHYQRRRIESGRRLYL